MKRLAACGLVLLAACARRPPAPPALQNTDPAVVIAEVAAREAALRTLRARFSVTTRSATGERSVNGALLVSRPDRLRFRLLLPLGITVFDYLRSNEQAWLTLPMGATDEAFAYASQTLPRTFARFTDDRGIGDCKPSDRVEAGQIWLECFLCGGDVCHWFDRMIRVRLNDAAITEDQLYAADSLVSITRYEDYRTVDGAYLPFRIVIEDVRPDKQRTVDVTIDRYEVNPALADDLFAPIPGSEPIPVVP